MLDPESVFESASGNGARIAEITSEGVEVEAYDDVASIPNPDDI